MIKPKGYNVYPKEVENFISDKFKDRAESVGVVGMHHDVFSEAIVAFIEEKKDKDITVDEVNKACKEMAAYKRPSHVVILDYNDMPLNRVQKTDYQALKKMAEIEIEKLRNQGKWDAE